MNLNQELIIDKYANLYGNTIKKFYLICKYILTREIQETEKNVDELSLLLHDEPTKFLTLSDVFLSSIKPFYDLLSFNFFPIDKQSKNFSKVYFHPSYVYPVIQSSIMIFTKKLSLFNNLVCKSIRENQMKIDMFEEKFGMNTISKSIVIIDKQSKINFNDQLKEGTCSTPLELIDIYSQYLCENLSSNNYFKGINHLNTIADLLKNNIITFNDYKLELKEINVTDVPAAIKNSIICEIEEEHIESATLSKFISSFQECRDLETGKHYEDNNVKLKELNIECEKEFKEAFKSIYNELQKLSSLKKCNQITDNKDSLKNIDFTMKKYLDKLNKFSERMISFITNQDIENEMKFNKLLTELDLDENIYSDEIFVHFNYLPKIIKEIKILEKYISKLELRVDQERRVKLNYLRLQSIDKSILKYMCETMMRQDIYLHNYLKFNWVNFLFNCSIDDIFQEFNISLSNKLNANYLLTIGSIYNRLPHTLIYECEDSKFFQNKHLIEKIKNEYYEGLKNGLGSLISRILVEMLNSIKIFDKNQTHVSIDSKPNFSVNISKKKLTSDHYPCFCTINYQNTPISLLHNTIDYMITYICVNYVLNFGSRTNLYDILVDLLMNESFTNLTEMVYSRWALWLCVFVGKLISVSWESNLKIDISDQKIKEIAFKHLKNYIINPNSLKIKLVEDKSTYESKINYDRLKEVMQNPRKFPDKNELITKIKINSLKFQPTFKLSKDGQLEEKFIILNKVGKLSCTTIYNYSDYLFTPINIESTELTITFS